MGAALQLLGRRQCGALHLLFGIVCIGPRSVPQLPRYAAVLKWTTLSSVHLCCGGVRGARSLGPQRFAAWSFPKLQWNAAYATAFVAILGTTISPYLFFWQAGQEIEEERRHHAKPLCVTPATAAGRTQADPHRHTDGHGVQHAHVAGDRLSRRRRHSTPTALRQSTPPRRRPKRCGPSPAVSRSRCSRSGSSAPACSRFRSWPDRPPMR